MNRSSRCVKAVLIASPIAIKSANTCWYPKSPKRKTFVTFLNATSLEETLSRPVFQLSAIDRKQSSKYRSHSHHLL